MSLSAVPDFEEGGDADEEQDAMMAEMGFASFGSKGSGPKAKKVKLRQDGEAEVGTGGNMIPLGKGRRDGNGRSGRGMEENQTVQMGQTAGKVMGTGVIGSATAIVDGYAKGSWTLSGPENARTDGVRLTPRVMGIEDHEPFEDPRYDDDEDTTVQSESSIPQKSNINALPMNPLTGSHPAVGNPGSGGGGGGQVQGQRRTDGKREDGSWDWQALRRGVRDERGDMAYYDRSFVEDPWRALRGERT